MTQRILTADDKAFFGLVSRAAFANPFGVHRSELDKEISSAAAKPGTGEITQQAVSEVQKRIRQLDEDSAANIRQFKEPDRHIIEHVFLFGIYHLFNSQFDELIVDQIKAGSEPAAVPFAKDALAMLAKRGFDNEATLKYFALFFQIRRSFHFIQKGLIGKSDSMRKLRMNLWNNIFTYDIVHYERFLWDKMDDFSTLLLGPTGSGKGAAAAAIGRSGFIPFDEKKQRFVESFTKVFIPINLSQYPETLLESELFGHTKGAFTGATTSHDGLFSLCSKHGSIFLDEVGDVSVQVQIKLLQILQDRIFSPVGSHEKLKFHGRVIAATNKSIDKIRREGKFRDDFYYRLCTDSIDVPTLQERIRENAGELRELVSHTVEHITGQVSDELTDTVLDVIHIRLGDDYAWPGNVRELAQCVRRVIIKRDYQGQKLQADNLESALTNDIIGARINAAELVGAYCKILYQKFGTYEAVARKTDLDRRTVKKYIES